MLKFWKKYKIVIFLICSVCEKRKLNCICILSYSSVYKYERC